MSTSNYGQSEAEEGNCAAYCLDHSLYVLFIMHTDTNG